MRLTFINWAEMFTLFDSSIASNLAIDVDGRILYIHLFCFWIAINNISTLKEKEKKTENECKFPQFLFLFYRIY